MWISRRVNNAALRNIVTGGQGTEKNQTRVRAVNYEMSSSGSNYHSISCMMRCDMMFWLRSRMNACHRYVSCHLNNSPWRMEEIGAALRNTLYLLTLGILQLSTIFLHSIFSRPDKLTKKGFFANRLKFNGLKYQLKMRSEALTPRLL